MNNTDRQPHPKVRHGRCPTCGHYGDDCTGTVPALLAYSIHPHYNDGSTGDAVAGGEGDAPTVGDAIGHAAQRMALGELDREGPGKDEGDTCEALEVTVELAPAEALYGQWFTVIGVYDESGDRWADEYAAQDAHAAEQAAVKERTRSGQDVTVAGVVSGRIQLIA